MGHDQDRRGNFNVPQANGNPNATVDRVFGLANQALNALGQLAGTAERADRVRRARGNALYRVVEAIDAETSKATYIVSDGTNKAECSTRDFADHLARTLNGAE